MKALACASIASLALTLIGCGTLSKGGYSQVSRPKIDLDACFYYSTDATTHSNRNAYDMYKGYVVAKHLEAHPYPFRSSPEVESLEDSRNCDVMIHILTTPHLLSVDTRVDIVSAYSKARLAQLDIPKSKYPLVADKIITALAPNEPIYVQVVNDREERRRKADQPVSGMAAVSKEELNKIVQAAVKNTLVQTAPPTAPAPSDVDAPNYQSPEDPTKYALVVGAEKYADLPEAQYAQRDAEAVRSHLVALGYPSRNIVLLTGPKATRAGLTKNLETWLVRNTDERSTVLFYYSGHGAPNAKTGQAYLVPIDGDPQYLEDTAYPVKRVYETLASLKAKRVLVMLDACFSGAGGRSVLSKGARPLVSKIDLGYAGMGQILSLTASGTDQIAGSLDEQRHGLFTYYLLKGLNGAATDDLGKVSVDSLYQYLAPKVADEAHRQNRDQTPKFLAPSRREPGDSMLR